MNAGVSRSLPYAPPDRSSTPAHRSPTVARHPRESGFPATSGASLSGPLDEVVRLPSLAPDEHATLRADIAARGVQVPVEVDEDGAILDGYERAAIATELGIGYPVIVREGLTDAGKLAHRLVLNLARRHLTKETRDSLIRELRARGLSLPAIRDTMRQAGASVGYGTIQRATQGVRLDRVAGRDGKSYPASPTARRGIPLALTSSASPEWYTPPHVLDLVVELFGAIDLDPCAESDRSVPAARHFTAAEDGLAHEWHGRVFLNPPYGKTIGLWMAKLRYEFAQRRVTEAIALVPAKPDTDWWAALDGEWMCFVHGRLRFANSSTGAPFPSVLVYLGPDAHRFTEVFRALGDVWQRIELRTCP